MFNKNKKSFAPFSTDKILKENVCGIVVESWLKGKALEFLSCRDAYNSVVYGSPGTGKSMYVLVPTILLNAKSNRATRPTMIINDIKGELFNLTSKTLKDEGYNVININLRCERESTRFNPLDIIWDTFQTYIRQGSIQLVDNNTGEYLATKKFILKKGTTEAVYNKDDESLSIGLYKNDFSYIYLENGLKNIWIKGMDGTKYRKGFLIIPNQNQVLECYDNNDKLIYTINYLKPNDMKDKAGTYLRETVNVIIPEGGGENKSWNDGSRGIIEGIIWGFLEDSLIPELNMTKEKFTLWNISNALNKSLSTTVELIPDAKEGRSHAQGYNPGQGKTQEMKTLQSWLKYHDAKLSEAILSASLIIDNQSEKTVSSYISNTQVFLKNFITSGLAYITSASDFSLNSLLGEQPTALFINIPDEEKSKWTLATLIICQIYNYLIFQASTRPNNKLERRVYFFLDEFGQMPKIGSFPNWMSASRSRNIMFMIILQSLSQLDASYDRNDRNTILNDCQLQMFLGASDEDTIKFFQSKLGTYTVFNRSASIGEKSSFADNFQGNLSLAKKDLVTLDELQQIQKGHLYFTTNRMKHCKSSLIPCFDKQAQKIFDLGSIDLRQSEKPLNEIELFYDLKNALKIRYRISMTKENTKKVEEPSVENNNENEEENPKPNKSVKPKRRPFNTKKVAKTTAQKDIKKAGDILYNNIVNNTNNNVKDVVASDEVSEKMDDLATDEQRDFEEDYEDFEGTEEKNNPSENQTKDKDF